MIATVLDFVRHHPWPTAGFALGLCFALAGFGWADMWWDAEGRAALRRRLRGR